MTENEEGAQSVEVAATEPTAMFQMERASIDIQIATAHAYPRSIDKFLSRAKALVAVDEETAQSCLYRRPVGKEGGKMVYAEGESIRMAEIVAACYGNLRAQVIIAEMNPTYVKAIGMAMDLESNYAVRAEVVESTVDRNGRPYSERMRVVAAKACQSKALRDAIFRVVSKSLCKSIVGVAKDVALGKGQTTGERRENVKKWLTLIHVPIERVCEALGVPSIENMGDNEFLTLAGLKTAIKDGDITIDEAFPLPEEDKPKGVEGVKETLKARRANSKIVSSREGGESSKAPETTANVAQEPGKDQGHEGAGDTVPGQPPSALPPVEEVEKNAEEKFGKAGDDWKEDAGGRPGTGPEELFVCLTCKSKKRPCEYTAGQIADAAGRCPRCLTAKDLVPKSEAEDAPAPSPAPAKEPKATVRCLGCKKEYAEKPAKCDCGSSLGWKKI